MKYYIGVDVGTSSVRAGLFRSNGTLIITKSHHIKINEPEPELYEQSSDDIWQATCTVVKVGILWTKMNS